MKWLEENLEHLARHEYKALALQIQDLGEKVRKLENWSLPCPYDDCRFFPCNRPLNARLYCCISRLARSGP